MNPASPSGRNVDGTNGQHGFDKSSWGTVVVPVHASAVEQIARRHDGRVIRTKANPTALMEECRRDANVVLGGSGEIGFISAVASGFDAMFCIAD